MLVGWRVCLPYFHNKAWNLIYIAPIWAPVFHKTNKQKLLQAPWNEFAGWTCQWTRCPRLHTTCGSSYQTSPTSLLGKLPTSDFSYLSIWRIQPYPISQPLSGRYLTILLDLSYTPFSGRYLLILPDLSFSVCYLPPYPTRPLLPLSQVGTSPIHQPLLPLWPLPFHYVVQPTLPTSYNMYPTPSLRGSYPPTTS